MSHNTHQSNALKVVDTRKGRDKSWLIHQRLGYPFFKILKWMFLDEFKGFYIEYLICDVFERAKHKRHSYSFRNTKKTKTISTYSS